uniref:Uncharacterized protein n=1 Tax=Sipha flava TaxID=143950 RepID=A0A2S2QJF4_9HEMI
MTKAAASGHHTASHVARERERTMKVIPQIQCAPSHARSLSVHGIFVSHYHRRPRGTRSTHLHTGPTLHPLRNAHPPLNSNAHRSMHIHGVHNIRAVPRRSGKH